MHDALEDQIRELLASGNKIAAIKRYREATGVGLAEAKSAVESLEAGGTFAIRDPADGSDLTDQIVSLLGRGEKIEAIKLYREKFRVDLRGAKEAVERIGEQNGIRVSSETGCLSVLFVIAVVTGLLC